ncbi:hypothetical protein BTO32_11350 [Marinobacter lutaoensis]|uniref:Phage tail fibre protein N-terminal domain-containing protein n=1 Tax=Marinobacter lutaoensis TaxID=135739 RepID=A0A1V2DRC8_9GAMM|nr:phage tail protein [Marinobacter lutaoensis]ONF43274.1 hypothetical protein BTO32_11350 [Marinobacter lutaoensis]
MSTAFKPVITQAGITAVFNATHSGLQANIVEVALGDQGWSPEASATALKREKRRIPISNGNRLSDNQIHITAIEDGQLAYWVREIGFYLDDGTLLAIWSHPSQPLAYKAAGVDLLLAFDLALSALPADSVKVIGTGGVNLSPATTEQLGVVRLATLAEAKAGTVPDEAVTPAGMRAHGDARYARVSHHHPWDQIDGKPAAYPPSAHQHGWAEIDGKPSTYPPASHNHDGRYVLLASQTRVTYGRLQTTARRSSVGWWNGYDSTAYNYVDIYPPYGYTMSHLIGFIASIGAVHYAGEVDDNDSIWLKWHRQSDRVRVVCNNSENRAASQINYLALWRK